MNGMALDDILFYNLWIIFYFFEISLHADFTFD